MTLLSLSPLHAALAFLAAFFGGALNSVAGGGSFLTFPTLLFLGLPPIAANATSTVALWPGSIASVGAYRNDLAGQRSFLIPFSLISLAGGYAGARLLLDTPQAMFRTLVPWLLLVATAVFAFGGPIIARFRAKALTNDGAWQAPLPVILGIQLVISIYGGYFGGGMGILMLATFSLLGMENLHAMNGLKNWLAVCINGIAVAAFVAAHTVLWPFALVMLTGSVAGGFLGAATARKLNPKSVRYFIIVVGAVLTSYFFINP